MRIGFWLGRIGLGLLALLLLLTAWGYWATRERPVDTRRIVIRGDVGFAALPAEVSAAGTTPAPVPVSATTGGPVHIRVFQAWHGAGVLRHPLEELTRFTTPVGRFEQAIDYPLDDGEGLIVYAWHDADGDGAHCTPTRRDEPAALQAFEQAPAEAVEVRLRLSERCVGPEFYYPR